MAYWQAEAEKDDGGTIMFGVIAGDRKSAETAAEAVLDGTGYPGLSGRVRVTEIPPPQDRL